MGLQAPEESKGESSLIFDTGVAYMVGHKKSARKDEPVV
jgi:hypothetical protein